MTLGFIIGTFIILTTTALGIKAACKDNHHTWNERMVMMTTIYCFLLAGLGGRIVDKYEEEKVKRINMEKFCIEIGIATTTKKIVVAEEFNFLPEKVVEVQHYPFATGAYIPINQGESVVIGIGGTAVPNSGEKK